MSISTQAVTVIILMTTCFVVDQAQSAVANYKVYDVGGSVKAPRPLSTPMPPPPDSINKALKILVSFVVAPDGSVTDIKLVKKSTPDFDDFAKSVVSKWKFEPATKNGIPVAVRLESEFRSHWRKSHTQDPRLIVTRVIALRCFA